MNHTFTISTASTTDTTFRPTSTSRTSPWTRLIHLPLVSFVPQMTLALGAGLAFGRRRQDLVFAWFVQTVVFVLFNKVCTSQVCLVGLRYHP